MIARLVQFCRTLRAMGLDVGPGDAADAARALLAVDVTDRDQVFLALQTVLCRRVEDRPFFAAAFAQVWEGRPAAPLPPGAPGQVRVRLQSHGGPVPLAAQPPDGAGDGPEQEGGLPSYSPHALLRRDVGKLAPEEVPELERLAQELARRLAYRLSRRLRRHRRGAIDPGRTFRRALRQGGEILHLRRRRPRRTRARVVALLDVSGSMQPYGRFLLLFLAALAGRLPRLEAFTFSTHLTRVTRQVRARDLEGAARAAQDWAGGTRIGASLATFLAGYAEGLVDRRTALLILSDGLDTGDTELLAQAMARLRSLAGRIIWLNPLAGDPAYEPLARGMRAALPNVDVLAPAHSLESLMRLGQYLDGGKP